MAIDIGRREFVSALASTAVAWPVAARAEQTAKLPIIGFLGPTASGWPETAAFAERLGQLGWSEGRTIVIEYRWSEGRPERVAEIAAEFVQQKVDAIVTYGGAVTTFKKATAVIPIVFAIAADPIGSGLVSAWIEAHGFAGIQKSVRSVAIELAENIDAIEAWRSTLDERARRRLVHPLSNVRRWRASTAHNAKSPTDLRRDAKAAWARFRSCLEGLPADQAAPLWQSVAAEATIHVC